MNIHKQKENKIKIKMDSYDVHVLPILFQLNVKESF